MSPGGIPTIATVVEGHGEVTAFPELVRRIASHLGRFVVTPKPYRMGRGKMLRGGGLESAVRVVAARVGGAGGTIVLLDGDDDCPVELARTIGIALVANPVKTPVVVANREYEAWFLASIDSLISHPSVRSDASWADDPDEPRDAKKRLELRMTVSYKEVLHQPKFSSLIDIELAASTSLSFRRLVEVVDALTR